MAPTEIIIDTAAHARPVAPDAAVRIGGTVFSARCPKGHLWYQLAAAAQQDQGAELNGEQVARFITAVFDPADVESIEAMLEDPRNFEVDTHSLGQVYAVLFTHWQPFVEEYFKEMQDAGTNRAQRRSLAKLPAAKKAAKKATAAKAAAARRR